MIENRRLIESGSEIQNSISSELSDFIKLKILGSEVTSGSSELKTVEVPLSLSPRFLEFATSKNPEKIETLGILFGIEEENILRSGPDNEARRDPCDQYIRIGHQRDRKRHQTA